MPGFEVFGDKEKQEIMDVLETGVLFRYEFGEQRKGIPRGNDALTANGRFSQNLTCHFPSWPWLPICRARDTAIRTRSATCFAHHATSR